MISQEEADRLLGKEIQPPKKLEPQLLPVGTRIIFLKELTSDATGDCPAFLYARKGDGGVVTGHGCWEGHWVKWDNWKEPFGAKLGEDFIRDTNEISYSKTT